MTQRAKQLVCCTPDVHSPATTVREALQFSAALRLTAVGAEPSAVAAFVAHVMSCLDLLPLRDALVGLPGAFFSKTLDTTSSCQGVHRCICCRQGTPSRPARCAVSQMTVWKCLSRVDVDWGVTS